jgi:hypothetical protein
MKSDVLKWSEGHTPDKGISKETLNHHRLIETVSGLDVYENTPEAFRRAYEALGIDIINRVPLDNAPVPTLPGQIRPHPAKPYHYSHLGVYDTAFRQTFPCKSPEDVWNLDVNELSYDDLLTPVPHPCTADDIRAREAAIGETGMYYPMLYTTLFMWAVEALGWEIFMVAAFTEKRRFHDHFLIPCVEKSRKIVAEMAQASNSPFIFVHDDLASGTGPIFPPSWYDEYIFPHYPEIWQDAKSRGKKVIFVADGDMTEFLPRLVDAGVDGIMFENPATDIDTVIECFGRSGQFMIGGIETVKLTMGHPEEVREMVFDLHEKMQEHPGFAMSSCGGLHNNIPMENMEAYFDARAEIGVTPQDWRTRCYAGKI